MSFYQKGVLDIKTKNLNHGVQAVGYDLEAEVPYVKIRNSWGARWGEGGYVNVNLDEKFNGGIFMAASYPDFGDATKKPGLGECKSGEKPDAAKNCLCTYGGPCDKKKPHGKDKDGDGCDDECGCGEFGFCR
jgi:hypothetical protein